jgi:hypothetical protein
MSQRARFIIGLIPTNRRRAGSLFEKQALGGIPKLIGRLGSRKGLGCGAHMIE